MGELAPLACAPDLAKPERIVKEGRYVEFGPSDRIPRTAVARVLHGALVAGLERAH